MKQPQNKKTTTKAQLEKRIERAVVHVDRTKETKEIFFSDKGLRLTLTNECAVVGTGYHDHVFTNFTSSGVSRPYLYIKRFIEIAEENDCTVTDADGYKFFSYGKLMNTLKEKGENDVDYLTATFVDEWFYNIFNPLFSIGETEVYGFMVFLDYMYNIAKNAILLDEHKEGLTNKQFIDGCIAKIREFSEDITERVIFEPKTDEQVMQENIKAIQDAETEEMLKKEAIKQQNEEND